MSSSLSGLTDNLSEGVHSDKSTDCNSCFDYMLIKNNQLIFRFVKKIIRKTLIKN